MGVTDELLSAVRGIVVDHLRALLRQGARVLDTAVRVRLDHTPGLGLLAERGILRVVRVLRLVLGIPVISSFVSSSVSSSSIGAATPISLVRISTLRAIGDRGWLIP